MHFLFLDESGTSNAPHETITIVCGVRFNPEDVDLAAIALENTIDRMVPTHFRENFIFHMKELFGDKRFRENWNVEERFRFIHEIMKLPRMFGASISFSLVRRSMKLGSPENDISDSEGQHSFAFSHCLSSASRAFDNLGYTNGPIKVIAEDVPEMQRLIKHGFATLAKAPLLLTRESLLPTEWEDEKGITPTDKELNLKNIDKEVIFSPKQDNTLLQLADACAFGIRRYFSEKSGGDLFIESILGHKPKLEYYKGECSFMTFNFNKSTAEMIRYITNTDSITHIYF